MIIRAIDEDEATPSGIVVRDASEDRPRKGLVIAVGDGNYDAAAIKRMPLDVAEGDEVLYSKYGATEIQVDGEELLVLRKNDVVATTPGSRRPRLGRSVDVSELRAGVEHDIELLRALAR